MNLHLLAKMLVLSDDMMVGDMMSCHLRINISHNLDVRTLRVSDLRVGQSTDDVKS